MPVTALLVAGPASASWPAEEETEGAHFIWGHKLLAWLLGCQQESLRDGGRAHDMHEEVIHCYLTSGLYTCLQWSVQVSSISVFSGL